MVTKGGLEAEVANAVVRFQREQQGRGPTDVHAYLIGDLILVRCTGIFTATETRLAMTEEGRRLIKSVRNAFIGLGMGAIGQLGAMRPPPFGFTRFPLGNLQSLVAVKPR